MSLALRTYATREALAYGAADYIGQAIEAAIDARGAACVALSGGATPEPAYAALAVRPFPWRSVTFALVDERFVPPDHAASNEGMLRRALAPALASGAKLRAMYAPTTSVEAAAEIANAAYAPLAFDIAVMGMGADGHTASWFPGAAALSEALDPANPRTVVALRADGADGAAERLTLTRAALMRARATLLLITGAEKRAKLQAALSQPPETAPVAALFAGSAPTVLWAP